MSEEFSIILGMMLFVIFSQENKDHHASVITKFQTSRLSTFDFFQTLVLIFLLSTMLQVQNKGKQLTALASVLLSQLKIGRPRLPNPVPHLPWKSNLVIPNSKNPQILDPQLGFPSKVTATTLVKLYQFNMDIWFPGP